MTHVASTSSTTMATQSGAVGLCADDLSASVSSPTTAAAAAAAAAITTVVSDTTFAPATAASVSDDLGTVTSVASAVVYERHDSPCGCTDERLTNVDGLMYGNISSPISGSSSDEYPPYSSNDKNSKNIDGFMCGNLPSAISSGSKGNSLTNIDGLMYGNLSSSITSTTKSTSVPTLLKGNNLTNIDGLVYGNISSSKVTNTKYVHAPILLTGNSLTNIDGLINGDLSASKMSNTNCASVPISLNGNGLTNLDGLMYGNLSSNTKSSSMPYPSLGNSRPTIDIDDSVVHNISSTASIHSPSNTLFESVPSSSKEKNKNKIRGLMHTSIWSTSSTFSNNTEIDSTSLTSLPSPIQTQESSIIENTSCNIPVHTHHVKPDREVLPTHLPGTTSSLAVYCNMPDADPMYDSIGPQESPVYYNAGPGVEHVTGRFDFRTMMTKWLPHFMCIAMLILLFILGYVLYLYLGQGEYIYDFNPKARFTVSLKSTGDDGISMHILKQLDETCFFQLQELSTCLLSRIINMSL